MPGLLRTTYNNANGTAVAFDVENLQITYDLVDGVGNPSGVKMNACRSERHLRLARPAKCSPNQIRKINVTTLHPIHRRALAVVES